MSVKLSNISELQDRIFTIRGFQVMVDRDLAELYGVENKRLNEQVKRNIERFPEKFRFRISEKEEEQLVAICDRFITLKHSISLPYVFTEQGVSMLSAVLRSKTAVQVSVQIMDAFVGMRKLLVNNASIFQRLDDIEQKQLIADTKFSKIFASIETKEVKYKQGIFFNGQVFDAYSFVSDIIRKTKESIVLVDNYVDDSVLTLFSKRKEKVKCIIFTKKISKQLALDLKKHNEQYSKIKIVEFTQSHDRFLIIDDKDLYHIGASIKDLGKKWFAFSKINTEILSVLDKLKKIQL